MAGNNQHFIPQLLLRGFLSSRHGEYAWEFHKDRGPEEKPIPIADIASEFQFYGLPEEEGGVEDRRITKRENKFGQLLDLLRKAHRGSSIIIPSNKKQLLVEFVIRSIIRTAHMRQNMRDLTLPPLDQFLGSLSPVPDNPGARLGAEIFNAVFKGRIEQIIKTTHSTSSAAPVSPESKYQRYYSFLWSIEVFPAKTLILGDLGPVVICGATLTMNGAFSHTDEARALLFPIAHDLLLIGKAPGEEALPVPDAEAINLASAELSRAFFVATQNESREASYFTYLARRAQKFLDVLNDDKGSERVPHQADG